MNVKNIVNMVGLEKEIKFANMQTSQNIWHKSKLLHLFTTNIHVVLLRNIYIPIDVLV